MSAQYKKILSGYVNDSKQGTGKYLSIKNVSEEPIVLEPGQSLFLNMTPADVREKYPKVPLFTKSIKIEEGQERVSSSEVADQVPF